MKKNILTAMAMLSFALCQSSFALTAKTAPIVADTAGTLLTLSGTNTDTFVATISEQVVSPSAGRSNRLDALLDACIGHANVDALTNYSSCEAACSDSAKNTHCELTDATTCVVRCQCKFNGVGCNSNNSQKMTQALVGEQQTYKGWRDETNFSGDSGVDSAARAKLHACSDTGISGEASWDTKFECTSGSPHANNSFCLNDTWDTLCVGWLP
jgi:hypothetical protein